MIAEIDGGQRAKLVGLALRMLGSANDAEDAVQEGLARWHQLPGEARAGVREPVAWLTRVISRICLDQLKSARVQRERYRGIWLPEPHVGPGQIASGAGAASDPADTVTLEESISFAFLVALEKLTPAERVSYILHDVFAVPFAEIADTVGRTPAACRQLAASARRNLALEPRFDVQSDERDAVVTAFMAACRGGDLAALVAVLDPHVVSTADGGVHVNTARLPVEGAERVGAYLLGVMKAQRTRMTDQQLSCEDINGHSGIVIRDEGRLAGTIDVAVTDGLVTRIAIQVNADKL